MQHWSPLAGASIYEVTRRQVASHTAALAIASGPVAAARARSALSAMFNWAIREGYELAANPVAGSNRPTEPPSRSRVLNDDELSKVWHACADDDFGRIIRLLVLTGQRREEVGGDGGGPSPGLRCPSPLAGLPLVLHAVHEDDAASDEGE